MTSLASCEYLNYGLSLLHVFPEFQEKTNENFFVSSAVCLQPANC